MTEAKHTPTPWKVSEGLDDTSVTIRQDNGEFHRPVAEIWYNGDDPSANAAFIVRAVNSHADMLAALKAIKAEPYGCPFCDSGTLRNPVKGHNEDCGYHLLEAAIAKAEGRS